MKKIISVVLSIVMLVSVGMATIPAFAIVGSQESVTTPTHNKIIPQVNGKDDNDVTWEWVSDNPKTIKFTYNGDGTLQDWDFGDLEEGVDYRIVEEDGNSITIELLNDYDGEIVANAIVEDEGESTTSAKTTTSANKSSTSPKTGAAAAAGIAAMGAGVAILTALKKKED